MSLPRATATATATAIATQRNPTERQQSSEWTSQDGSLNLEEEQRHTRVASETSMADSWGVSLNSRSQGSSTQNLHTMVLSPSMEAMEEAMEDEQQQTETEGEEEEESPSRAGSRASLDLSPPQNRDSSHSSGALFGRTNRQPSFTLWQGGAEGLRQPRSSYDERRDSLGPLDDNEDGASEPCRSMDPARAEANDRGLEDETAADVSSASDALVARCLALPAATTARVIDADAAAAAERSTSTTTARTTDDAKPPGTEPMEEPSHLPSREEAERPELTSVVEETTSTLQHHVPQQPQPQSRPVTRRQSTSVDSFEQSARRAAGGNRAGSQSQVEDSNPLLPFPPPHNTRMPCSV